MAESAGLIVETNVAAPRTNTPGNAGGALELSQANYQHECRKPWVAEAPGKLGLKLNRVFEKYIPIIPEPVSEQLCHKVDT